MARPENVGLLAPSILSADFGRLAAEIEAVEAAGADWIHIDVMDGRFVPNLTMGPAIVSACRKATRLPLDVHLMVHRPDRFVDEETPTEELERIENLLAWIDEELDDREQHILKARFGLNPDHESATLRAIGQELGISKERVRQIRLKAMDKLQELAGAMVPVVEVEAE